jgi:hypothetical protein
VGLRQQVPAKQLSFYPVLGANPVFFVFLFGCAKRPPPPPLSYDIFIWAWERTKDLLFLFYH